MQEETLTVKKEVCTEKTPNKEKDPNLQIETDLIPKAEEDHCHMEEEEHIPTQEAHHTVVENVNAKNVVIKESKL